MQIERRLRVVRPLGIASVLLLSTAIAAPAFAQIEEVIVTAQKKSEDIQTVPIAISAYTSQDLKAHQVQRFQDLQFSTPNVSYTKDNFYGTDFQIRGIGVTAVGYDSENGVAINFNDVYLANPNLADNGFYDLQRIEVLRGPQSTLYGRTATGGAVSVVANKPELDGFASDLEATYGNYDYQELKGMVNIPIVTDQLGLRIAGDWMRHAGYTTNIYNNTHVDDRNQYSVRGSLRWQPTNQTTVDFTAAFSNEGDHKMRSQKQLCHTDPTGVLGCLPDAATVGGVVNQNAVLSNIASSEEGLSTALGPTLGSALGLTSLIAPAPAISNPTDIRTIDTNYNPTYKAQDNFLSLEWKQTWTNWLDSTFVGGYDREFIVSQEGYNNTPGTAIDPLKLATAEGTLLAVLSNPALSGSPVSSPAYAANFVPFMAAPFGPLPMGSVPISNLGGLGILTGNPANYSSTNMMWGYDQSNDSSTQWSGELRFNTKFNGPLNGMLAVYYMDYHNSGNYFVYSPGLDYASIVLGAMSGLTAAGAPLCAATGCLIGPSFYNNNGAYDSIRSKSMYGEVYYDAVPDTLKFTLGARWTEDEKSQRGRIELLSGLVPLGTTNENNAMAALAAQGQKDFDGSNGTPPYDVWQINSVKYDKWTGRAVVDWTPKLDFTDATLVYASYSRGYKAGGFNPGVLPGTGVSKNYGPEQIDAYELGTKNTLLDGTLQANADFWYYDYKGLQVSEIVDSTSVNQNLNAKLYGVEGEFIWAPDEHWQFNLNVANTQTDIGNASIVDTRNPTNGNPNTLLVKDDTLVASIAQNCLLYYNGAAPGSLPVGFVAPGGSTTQASHALTAYGIPNVAYGSCMSPTTDMTSYGFPGMNYGQVLALQGFSTTDPSGKGLYDGVPVNLKGHRVQNTPENTISFGVQYTQPLPSNYRLVGRFDYYWQSDMFGTIFNSAADKISSWDVMNMQLTLNSPDDTWYVTAFVKNLANKDNLTGIYVDAQSTGLFTNGFYGEPRTYGLTVGVHL